MTEFLSLLSAILWSFAGVFVLGVVGAVAMSYEPRRPAPGPLPDRSWRHRR